MYTKRDKQCENNNKGRKFDLLKYSEINFIEQYYDLLINHSLKTTASS